VNFRIINLNFYKDYLPSVDDPAPIKIGAQTNKKKNLLESELSDNQFKFL
jgi:hypothetical protein